MSRAKKIFFVAAHRPDRSPSQRYRFEQYFSILTNNGFEYTLAYLINKEDDIRFYGPYSPLLKLLLLLKFFLMRVKHVWQSRRYDFIFIQREAYFIGGPFFERLFKIWGKPLIFDFDDAIWLPNVSQENAKWGFLKYPQKTSKIISICDKVICGNAYLEEYAKQFNQNTILIPSTIDLSYYQIDRSLREPGVVCIGWSGSGTTVPYFDEITPALIRLKEEFGDRIKFVVYGDPNYRNEALGIEGIRWSPDTEVHVINSFDIGIMPIPDTEWAKGKCSMKGLQYMALGITTVMSAVGTNKVVITPGENGELCSDLDTWYVKLKQLIESETLRNQLGAAGKLTVEKEYSSRAQSKAFLELFSLS